MKEAILNWVYKVFSLLEWEMLPLSCSNHGFFGNFKYLKDFFRLSRLLQSQKLWYLHPLPPYSMLVAGLLAHSWPPVPDIAFSDLAQHLIREEWEFWVPLSYSNIFLGLSHENCEWVSISFVTGSSFQSAQSPALITQQTFTCLITFSESTLETDIVHWGIIPPKKTLPPLFRQLPP